MFDDFSILECQRIASFQDMIRRHQPDMLIAECKLMGVAGQHGIGCLPDMHGDEFELFRMLLKVLRHGRQTGCQRVQACPMTLKMSGNEYRKTCGQYLPCRFLCCQLVACRFADGFPQLVEQGKLLCHAVDQKRGHGRRRFHTRMGYLVDDRIVAFMPDAGNDGQGELRTVGGQRI